MTAPNTPRSPMATPLPAKLFRLSVRPLPTISDWNGLAAAGVRRRREHRTDRPPNLAGAEFRTLGMELAWFLAAGSRRSRQMEAPLSLPAFTASHLQHRWKKLLTIGKRLEMEPLESPEDANRCDNNPGMSRVFEPTNDEFSSECGRRNVSIYRALACCRGCGGDPADRGLAVFPII